MKTQLAYGKTGLTIELPDDPLVSVVEPLFRPSAGSQMDALLEALQHPIASGPLRERAAKAKRIGIVVNDITRATPNELILGAIARELGSIDDARVVLFNATGTHRANTDAELEGILGAEALRRFRVVQNDARREEDHVSVGVAESGNDIRLHRELLECDLKILTGFIEPHFFAGFSGGGKAIMPGMAALSTIVRNHCAENMDHPRSTWGVTEDNPVYTEVQEAAGMVDGCFLLNVALNRDKEITAVFAGDLREAHRAGCAYVRETSMVPVQQPFDIVITSNSGYPLDLNLYQSVKGMSAAAGIVKEGGAIIVASECWDGVPDHGHYGHLLSQADSPADLLGRIRTAGFHMQDMWQAQIHARIVERNPVYFFSHHLSSDQLEAAFLQPCASIEQTVKALRSGGRTGGSICVLPEGPVTIPYFN